MTRNIGIVVFPDFQLLDASGPAAAFDVASRASRSAAYANVMLSARGGPVRSSAGVTVATTSLRRAPRLDTLLVVGGQGTAGAATDPAVLAFCRRRAARCRRVTSVCTGAFVLAAAGILEGRRATTHWQAAPRLARLFPRVTVEPDRIWVRDGNVWTSAGVTAGIDLALVLIEEDLGEAIARETARELVVYYRRPGGQSQFSALIDLAHPEGRFEPTLRFAREHLAEPLTVERLASHAAMSPRNFARLFTSEIGVTPAKAIERLRLEAARQQVEAGSDTVEQVAIGSGFGSAERMRRAFVRAFGQPPQAVRRSAQVPAARLQAPDATPRAEVARRDGRRVAHVEREDA